LSAIGFLGAALVVLGILGYVGTLVAILGGMMVAVSTYSMYKFHQDISVLAFSIGYQTAMMMEEDEELEEE
jgi:flagellar motor component MotA